METRVQHRRVTPGVMHVCATERARERDARSPRVSIYLRFAPSLDKERALKGEYAAVKNPVFTYRCNTVFVRKTAPFWHKVTFLTPIHEIGYPKKGSNVKLS